MLNIHKVIIAVRNIINFIKENSFQNLQGIHVAYLISINILPSRKQHISKEARQALKKMDQYSREIELLAKNKIEDIDQLNNNQQQ